MGLIDSATKGIAKGMQKASRKVFNIVGSLGADVGNAVLDKSTKAIEKSVEHGAKAVDVAVSGKLSNFVRSVGRSVADVNIGDVSSKAVRQGVGVTGAKIMGSTFEANMQLPREIGTHLRAAANSLKPIKDLMFERAAEGKGGVLKHKMTGTGLAIMTGAAVVTGTGRAVGDFNAGRRGQGSPASVGPAPTYQRAYENNAGATGDLALGLHKLRRG